MPASEETRLRRWKRGQELWPAYKSGKLKLADLTEEDRYALATYARAQRLGKIGEETAGAPIPAERKTRIEAAKGIHERIGEKFVRKPKAATQTQKAPEPEKRASIYDYADKVAALSGQITPTSAAMATLVPLIEPFGQMLWHTGLKGGAGRQLEQVEGIHKANLRAAEGLLGPPQFDVRGRDLNPLERELAEQAVEEKMQVIKPLTELTRSLREASEAAEARYAGPEQPRIVQESAHFGKLTGELALLSLETAGLGMAGMGKSAAAQALTKRVPKLAEIAASRGTGAAAFAKRRAATAVLDAVHGAETGLKYNVYGAVTGMEKNPSLEKALADMAGFAAFGAGLGAVGRTVAERMAFNKYASRQIEGHIAASRIDAKAVVEEEFNRLNPAYAAQKVEERGIGQMAHEAGVGPKPVDFREATTRKARLGAGAKQVDRHMAEIRDAIQLGEDARARSLIRALREDLDEMAADTAPERMELEQLEGRIGKEGLVTVFIEDPEPVRHLPDAPPMKYEITLRHPQAQNLQGITLKMRASSSPLSKKSAIEWPIGMEIPLGAKQRITRLAKARRAAVMERGTPKEEQPVTAAQAPTEAAGEPKPSAGQITREEAVSGKEGGKASARLPKKGNLPGEMFTSKTAEWYTPPELYQKYNEKYGPFDLDPAATDLSAKAPHYYTIEEDGLAQDWHWAKNVWVNPPYGREISKWTRKAAATAKKGSRVVMLLPARPGSKWFQEILRNPDAEVEFLSGRVKFVDESGRPYKSAAPFDSAIAVFNPPKGAPEPSGKVPPVARTKEGIAPEAAPPPKREPQERVALFNYHDPRVKELIRGQKAHYNPPQAREVVHQTLKEAMLTAIRKEGGVEAVMGAKPDLVTDVPPFLPEGVRRKNQGWDVTGRLARAVAEEAAVPYEEVLVKVRETARQHLTPQVSKKRANVKGAFAVKDEYKGKLKGRRVLLFDDNYNTGSTAKECAKVLEAEGAQVQILTVSQSREGAPTRPFEYAESSDARLDALRLEGIAGEREVELYRQRLEEKSKKEPVLEETDPIALLKADMRRREMTIGSEVSLEEAVKDLQVMEKLLEDRVRTVKDPGERAWFEAELADTREVLESMKKRQTQPQIGDRITEGWRAPSGYRVEHTIREEIHYHRKVLGNNDIAAQMEQYIPAERLDEKATSLLWVTREKKDALKYGTPEKVAIEGKIVAEDFEGGFLVLKDKDSVARRTSDAQVKWEIVDETPTGRKVGVPPEDGQWHPIPDDVTLFVDESYPVETKTEGGVRMARRTASPIIAPMEITPLVEAEQAYGRSLNRIGRAARKEYEQAHMDTSKTGAEFIERINEIEERTMAKAEKRWRKLKKEFPESKIENPRVAYDWKRKYGVNLRDESGYIDIGAFRDAMRDSAEELAVYGQRVWQYVTGKFEEHIGSQARDIYKLLSGDIPSLRFMSGTVRDLQKAGYWVLANRHEALYLREKVTAPQRAFAKGMDKMARVWGLKAEYIKERSKAERASGKSGWRRRMRAESKRISEEVSDVILAMDAARRRDLKITAMPSNLVEPLQERFGVDIRTASGAEIRNAVGRYRSTAIHPVSERVVLEYLNVMREIQTDQVMRGFLTPENAADPWYVTHLVLERQPARGVTFRYHAYGSEKPIERDAYRLMRDLFVRIEWLNEKMDYDTRAKRAADVLAKDAAALSDGTYPFDTTEPAFLKKIQDSWARAMERAEAGNTIWGEVAFEHEGMTFVYDVVNQMKKSDVGMAQRPKDGIYRLQDLMQAIDSAIDADARIFMDMMTRERMTEGALPQGELALVIVPEPVHRHCWTVDKEPRIVALFKKWTRWTRTWKKFALFAAGIGYPIQNFGDQVLIAEIIGWRRAMKAPWQRGALIPALREVLSARGVDMEKLPSTLGGDFVRQTIKDNEGLIYQAQRERILDPQATFIAEVQFPTEAEMLNRSTPAGWLNPLNIFFDLITTLEQAKRMGNFIETLDMIYGGQLKPENTWMHRQLRGLSTPQQAAKIVLTQTTDYAKVSPAQKTIRDMAMPFGTWYISQLHNSMGKIAAHSWRAPAAVQKKAWMGTITALLPFFLTQAWNLAMYPEIEESLSDYDRANLHVITGFKDRSGKPYVLSFPMPLTAMLGGIGLPNIMEVPQRWAASQVIALDKGDPERAKSFKQVLKEWYFANVAGAHGWPGRGAFRQYERQAHPAIRVAVGLATNKDPYTRRAIVPMGDEGTTKADRLRWSFVAQNWIPAYSQYLRGVEEGDIAQAPGTMTPNTAKAAVQAFTRGFTNLESYGWAEADIGRQIIRYQSMVKRKLDPLGDERYNEWEETLQRMLVNDTPETKEAHVKAVAALAEELPNTWREGIKARLRSPRFLRDLAKKKYEAIPASDVARKENARRVKELYQQAYSFWEQRPDGKEPMRWLEEMQQHVKDKEVLAALAAWVWSERASTRRMLAPALFSESTVDYSHLMPWLSAWPEEEQADARKE